MTSAVTTFSKEIHLAMKDFGVFDQLLTLFELYPFNNVLHLKVHEIFLHCLEQNDSVILEHLLEETKLVKKVFEIGKDNKSYTFLNSGNSINFGQVAFVRKLANQLQEMIETSETVSMILESIPEWNEFFNNEIEPSNVIENKPLAEDPRSCFDNNDDDEDDNNFFVELKDYNPDKQDDDDVSNPFENHGEESGDKPGPEMSDDVKNYFSNGNESEDFMYMKYQQQENKQSTEDVEDDEGPGLTMEDLLGEPEKTEEVEQTTENTENEAYYDN